MILLLLGLAIFFGVHVFSALRTREPGKDLRERMGFNTFMGIYSGISLLGFVLIVYGYGAMRPAAIVYTPPNWGALANMVLMLPALILVVASQLPAGHIKRAVKHPMLISVKLWAVGHLLANGELNSVLLFASFLAYAVFDHICVKRRGDLGGGATVSPKPIFDFTAIFVGLGLYVAFVVYLHAVLFGVSVVA